MNQNRINLGKIIFMTGLLLVVVGLIIYFMYGEELIGIILCFVGILDLILSSFLSKLQKSRSDITKNP